MGVRQLLMSIMLLSTSASFACAATPHRTCQEANPSEVTALLDRWQAAIAIGDADVIAEFYTDTAVLLPAIGEASREGKAAIRAYFSAFVGQHPLPTITMRSVMSGCGIATEMGAVRFQVAGARKGTRMFVGGRYSTVLKESDGSWLIAQQSLSLMPQLNRTAPLAR